MYIGKICKKFYRIIICNGRKIGNNLNIIKRRMNKYIMEYLYNGKLFISEN